MILHHQNTCIGRASVLLVVVFLALFAGASNAEVPLNVALHPPGFAVASATSQATAAGISILKKGGNAFDAAVAVTAALAVTEPYSSGLGGGGFWMLKQASAQKAVMVDGRETAPAAATATMYQDKNGKAIRNLSLFGALAGGIPGEPAAMAYIAGHYGKLGLRADLAPAIKLARQGFPVTQRFHDIAKRMASHLSTAARKVFLLHDKAPPVGHIIRQPDLAKTLEALAGKGRAGFYSGTVAKKLVAGVRADGGIWTLQDLARYRVKLRRPISCYFRAYHIISAAPPSAGGVGLCEILQQLEMRGFTHGGTAHEDAMVIEAMRRAYRDRAAWLGDPNFVKIPLRRLLSLNYADFLAMTTDPHHATPSTALPSPAAVNGRRAHAGHVLHKMREGRDTSSFSIIDSEGNHVAATITVNIRFGSNYMSPGTGVIINDEMDDFSASLKSSNVYGLIGSRANAIAPGKRPLSTMTPSFVSGPNGLLAFGTPGGSRILTMVALGVLHFVAGDDAEQIVSAPRYHMQYKPDRVQFEPGAFSPQEQQILKSMGYHLDKLDHRYGDMQAVVWNPLTDSLSAASDPRGVGVSEVVRPARERGLGRGPPKKPPPL